MGHKSETLIALFIHLTTLTSLKENHKWPEQSTVGNYVIIDYLCSEQSKEFFSSHSTIVTRDGKIAWRGHKVPMEPELLIISLASSTVSRKGFLSV